MSDYIKYRFPSEGVIEKKGTFSQVKMSEIGQGFIVSNFSGEIYSFTEQNSDKQYHFKEGAPEVYSEETYLTKATKFLDEIIKKNLKKAIFSRIKNVPFNTTKIDDFFAKLEESYPNSFVYLISSEKFGTWIGASPEILLETKHNISKTISLAGTKSINDLSNWTEKEILEQKYVTDFIENKLHKIGVNQLKRSETRDCFAGPVKHLRTEFDWKSDNTKVNRILSELHPTPAVSGYPRNEAIELIREIETHDRELYAGMIGYLGQNSTRVYVNLRCCQIQKNNAFLYLGGGFTKDSNVESEWMETENKSKTLLNIIEKL